MPVTYTDVIHTVTVMQLQPCVTELTRMHAAGLKHDNHQALMPL
jgi:hypothetical protein